MVNENIVNFALNVLGCGCDHSVFNTIEKSGDVLLGCGVMLSKKIVIGNRLLIYIADAGVLDPESVRAAIAEGVAERDRCGYNRLRLVVVTPEAGKLLPAYLQVFDSIAGRDDKTHLHVILPEEAV